MPDGSREVLLRIEVPIEVPMDVAKIVEALKLLRKAFEYGRCGADVRKRLNKMTNRDLYRLKLHAAALVAYLSLPLGEGSFITIEEADDAR